MSPAITVAQIGQFLICVRRERPEKPFKGEELDWYCSVRVSDQHHVQLMFLTQSRTCVSPRTRSKQGSYHMARSLVPEVEDTSSSESDRSLDAASSCSVPRAEPDGERRIPQNDPRRLGCFLDGVHLKKIRRGLLVGVAPPMLPTIDPSSICVPTMVRRFLR